MEEVLATGAPATRASLEHARSRRRSSLELVAAAAPVPRRATGASAATGSSAVVSEVEGLGAEELAAAEAAGAGADEEALEAVVIHAGDASRESAATDGDGDGNGNGGKKGDKAGGGKKKGKGAKKEDEGPKVPFSRLLAYNKPEL